MKIFSQLLDYYCFDCFLWYSKKTPSASDRDEIIVIPIEPFYGGGVRWGRSHP